MTLPKTLRSLLGVGVLLGVGLSLRADEAVTFQVDMSRYTNSAGQQAATLVDVRGAFNSWGGGWSLVNNTLNVYTNTYTVTGNTGDKFQAEFLVQARRRNEVFASALAAQQALRQARIVRYVRETGLVTLAGRILVVSRGWLDGEPLTHEIQTTLELSELFRSEGPTLRIVSWTERDR